MGAVLPLDAVGLKQLEIKLMNEGGGLQGMVGTFLTHVVRGEPA
jgi:hypothetical protein